MAAGISSNATIWVAGETTGKNQAGASTSLPVSPFLKQVTGAGAGYRVARGTAVLDGSNPTFVDTGLTHVYSATVTLSGIAAPGLNTMTLTSNITGSGFDVYAWKATGAGNPTLIASTGTEGFFWTAIGD